MPLSHILGQPALSPKRIINNSLKESVVNDQKLSEFAKQSLQILKGLLDFDTSVFCMNKLTT